ncbi:hypothetical protein LEP1GSC170_3433 [Leptospira interrogans serovar Bataviae str. HAI135]|nr:hypothetical protein LEP1GSC170_3433 [Leptospira interrogans serovar Bataviae str. HAI135]
MNPPKLIQLSQRTPDFFVPQKIFKNRISILRTKKYVYASSTVFTTYDSRILSLFVFFTVLKNILSLKTNLFFNSVSILLQNYGNFAT